MTPQNLNRRTNVAMEHNGWCMRRFACRNFQITTEL